MRGASALQKALRLYPDAAVRVLVVWEPVLLSDWGPPSSKVLSRISDSRAIQFWDPGRGVSDALKRAARARPRGSFQAASRELGRTFWDYVAFFTPGVAWDSLPPEPRSWYFPVVHHESEIVSVFAGMPAWASEDTTATSIGRAVAWIRDYYRAISDHRYRDAYTHWEQSGLAGGKSFDEFRHGYDDTEEVEAIVGAPGRVGAAAGSRYIEIPVQIRSRGRDGSRQEYSGMYTLRLSLLDGAAPEQRSWHIYSAKMQPSVYR